MKLRCWHAWVALHVFVVGLAACASAPPPPRPATIRVTIDVDATVNPDARGRPSPVIVRLYELKALAAFRSADFFSLFDRDQQTLGAELVTKEEYQLEPGYKRQFERKLQSDTRFIGVIAAFRDLERSQWRASMTVVPQETTPVFIRVESNKVSARFQ